MEAVEYERMAAVEDAMWWYRGLHANLLARTRELIAGCECRHGCPTCVGPVGNTGPLAKTVALRILDLITAKAIGEAACPEPSRGVA